MKYNPDSEVYTAGQAYFYIKGFRDGVKGNMDRHLGDISVYSNGYYAGLQWLKEEDSKAYYRAIMGDQF